MNFISAGGNDVLNVFWWLWIDGFFFHSSERNSARTFRWLCLALGLKPTIAKEAQSNLGGLTSCHSLPNYITRVLVSQKEPILVASHLPSLLSSHFFQVETHISHSEHVTLEWVRPLCRRPLLSCPPERHLSLSQLKANFTALCLSPVPGWKSCDRVGVGDSV